MPSGPDLEDGLADAEESGVVTDRRGLAVGRVAHPGGVRAGDAHARPRRSRVKPAIKTAHPSERVAG